MKKIIIAFIFLLLVISGYTQNVTVDILKNLEYAEQDYTAHLKKDIFDNLIFTDSNDNKLTYEKKYLQKHYPNLLTSENNRIDFFRFLIREYYSTTGYKALFSIDIFDTEIVEDNCNNKMERGTDIFGNPTYKDQIDGQNSSPTKDLLDTWEYTRGTQKATLKKDIFGKWCYKDSYNNKFELSSRTWKILLNRHGSEQNILIFLAHEFLPN